MEYTFYQTEEELANLWCASTWLCKMSELDYLEEPAMFHDVFGHIPVFMNREYADFVQQIGALGVSISMKIKLKYSLFTSRK
ncbi:MAG: phenylalanine-4-hydroxylase [Limisphaerales bacterium]